MLTRLLATLSLCLLMGCTTLSDLTLARRSSIDKEIAAARVETESRLRVLNDTQMGLLKQVAAEHAAREQAAADYLFKGLATFGTLRSPTRPELVMGQSIQQTALQLPPASATTQAATLKALQTELDETKVTTEALKTQYEAELGKARAEGETKAKTLTTLSTQLEQVDKDRVAALTAAREKDAALQAKKDEVQDAQLAAKTKEAAAAKSVQAMKLRFSSITGVLALLCIAGAIYSPVYKDKMGIAAVVFAIATAAIWYLEGWMVAVGIGVVVVALVVWAVKNHYIESKAAKSVYLAVQSVKDTAKDDYDRLIKPRLEEYLSVYRKDGTTVPDTAAIAHVDKVLMAADAK